MKILATIFLIALTIMSCKEHEGANDNAFAKAESANTTLQDEYVSYGAAISLENSLTKSEVAERYAALAEGDTAVVKFEAPINDVCASKGCWMRLDIADEEQVFVKFKDYGFFVPTDTKDGNAVVEGKAYLEEVSVDELRHMAEDAGKSKEEIAAITKPERELRFMADGVLIKAE
ncbi:uncharacterized protein DUF4920 [Dokdonia sp. Hel_I_63]|jgi:hypothetical protein|uniref:DUF4920 domain-containing protein n=1 Tax=unclassified Dokdonia TaxID=2615033 RepID=UPI00020A76A9|nr:MULTISPECIES: DUF4920 domain-containing protein [unclassified Dokdonia]AEE18703.1 hypothetical protein Krodi_0719 [Dokdonia sp. 4H-3-7-5]TVZ22068.1 uncharacterized protein DUF4920 [Dokdonia sp. Hel_I_63]